MLAVQALGAVSDSTSHRVRIVQAGAILRDPSVPGVQRLVGDVVLAHRDARLRCDSAWRYDDGRFSAMGNVAAERPGGWSLAAREVLWDPTAERLDAFGDPVRLVDDELSVEGPALQYDWAAEEVRFAERSTLVAGDRTARADRGAYFAATEWLVMGGRVEVEGPEERVFSDSLRVAVRAGDFWVHGATVIHGVDGSWTVRCERGRVAEDSGWVAGRAERAWVRRGGEGVWADSLAWSEAAGLREAWGDVEALDTALTRVVRGAHLVQQRTDSVWASRADGGALLVQAGQADTLVVQAEVLEQADGTLRAFPEVVFQQGDALGACGRLIWSESDSLLLFQQDPRLWFEGQILSADTLQLTLRNGSPDRLIGLGHAHLTHVLNDSCADQISGRTLHGEFEDGLLHRLLIAGNGEAIYFVEDGEALQFNRAACSRMRIGLRGGAVKEIALLDAPNGRFIAVAASVPAERWLEGTVLHVPPTPPEVHPWPPAVPRD